MFFHAKGAHQRMAAPREDSEDAEERMHAADPPSPVPEEVRGFQAAK